MKMESFLIILCVVAVIGGSIFVLLRSAALDGNSNWHLARIFWDEHRISARIAAFVSPSHAAVLNNAHQNIPILTNASAFCCVVSTTTLEKAEWPSALPNTAFASGAVAVPVDMENFFSAQTKFFKPYFETVEAIFWNVRMKLEGSQTGVRFEGG